MFYWKALKHVKALKQLSSTDLRQQPSNLIN